MHDAQTWGIENVNHFSYKSGKFSELKSGNESGTQNSSFWCEVCKRHLGGIQSYFLTKKKNNKWKEEEVALAPYSIFHIQVYSAHSGVLNDVKNNIHIEHTVAQVLCLSFSRATNMVSHPVGLSGSRVSSFAYKFNIHVW